MINKPDRMVLTAVVTATALFLSAFVPAGHAADGGAEPLAVILKIQDEVNSALSGIDREAASAARELGRSGVTGDKARETIRKLAKATSRYSVDCSSIDAKSIMAVVEPAEYKKYEGSDIGKQPQEVRLKKMLQPILADAFMSVEGFYATVIQYPVISPKGEFIGSVSVLLRPEKLLASVIEPAVKGLPVHAWAMQTDGRILYDQDAAQIGKMLFEDPMYKPFPNVTEFARKVAADKAGYGSYDFYDMGTRNVVKKDAVWATASLHGTKWRLVVATKEYSVNGKQDAVIRSVTQAAVSVLRAEYEKYKRGEVTEAQARKSAADILRSMRYGDDGKGYFWADTTEGINIVLPVDRSVEGTDRVNANLNNVYYIKEILANGKRQGGGYTDYWFPKPGSKDLSRKRGYSVLFAPFNWVIGTGYYPD